MAHHKNTDALKITIDGLGRFAEDARNPEVVKNARDAALAKQAGVQHVANRSLHTATP